MRAVKRGMRGHPLVGFHLHAKPCDPAKGAMQPALAWIDLIMECRYTAGTVNNNGRPMRIERGQLVGATSWLAARWNWTPMAVRWWLDKLETHGMISFAAPYMQSADDKLNSVNHNRLGGVQDVNNNRLNNRSRGRFANILTICNYELYQVSRESEQRVDQQVEQQANNRLELESQPVNNRLAYIENARALTKEQYKEQEYNNPPTPLAGGASVTELLPLENRGADRKADTTERRGQRAAETRRRNVERQQTLDQAMDLFNRAAEHWGFARCEVLSEARAGRLLRRLDEIGGLEKFRIALRAIGRDDFLAGRVAPRNGGTPFRLDIDRLLQTSGGLGDVLARLLELSAVPDRLVSPNGKEWGWWRGSEDKLRALKPQFWRDLLDDVRPNGTWPWWILAAPPGHPECLVHPDVLVERGLVAIYQGNIEHV